MKIIYISIIIIVVLWMLLSVRIFDLDKKLFVFIEPVIGLFTVIDLLLYYCFRKPQIFYDSRFGQQAQKRRKINFPVIIGWGLKWVKN